jgi:putative ABC transport system ATP-binding protein
MIICIDNEGRVAETGTYNELSKKKEGAFSKLMEWQMSGNEAVKSRPHGPGIGEEEEIEHDLQEGSDVEEGKGQMQEQGTKYRGEDITAGEAVAERTPKSTGR